MASDDDACQVFGRREINFGFRERGLSSDNPDCGKSDTYSQLSVDNVPFRKDRKLPSDAIRLTYQNQIGGLIYDIRRKIV